MKKLMIGLVGACAFGVMAEVASENVVGFNAETMVVGGNLTSSMFDVVGSEGMNVQSIIPSGKDIQGGDVTMKRLSKGLAELGEYTYFLEGDLDDGSPAGWYDDNGNLVEKVFNPGEGFILMNDGDGFTRTISGELKPGKPTWELICGGNLTGNISPIALHVQDIKVGTEIDTDGSLILGEAIESASVVMKRLSKGLAELPEYTFFLDGESAEGGPAGWYDDDGNLVDKTFAPGEGFILMFDPDEGFAQIPSPFEK